tara:strand:+ start:8235 stop:8621 length:387 start_codon:yes stop_codon:yes gene_type:complete
MKKLLLILLCVPLIGFGQIVDTIYEKKENNLPRINMMEMMQAERLTMEQGENGKIIWLFDGQAYTGFVYGEQRGEKIEGEFKNGVEHGSHKEWYDNGQLKKERIYNNGIKISTKKWDKEGNITIDIKH